MDNLSRSGKVTRVMNPVAAGQATNLSSAIDMQGFDSAVFYVSVSTIVSTGTVTCKLQGSANESASPDDYVDLKGTAVAYTDADDNKVAVLEIDHPGYRYLRCVVTTATANGTIDGVIAVQHKAKSEPVTHDSTTVVGSEYHLAPGAGTA